LMSFKAAMRKAMRTLSRVTTEEYVN
jgi:hypothetical protein